MLNRDAISSGAYLSSFDSLPKDILWTQAQIDKSLATAMSKRPPGNEVWVFAYGSLIWNPISACAEQSVATLLGWHRSFCIRLIAGRGSPAQPGRMLSLEPGGFTEGLALRLSDVTLDEELRILWIREMVTGAYSPTWATVKLHSGEEKAALAFVSNSSQSQYESDSTVSTIAPAMSVARGSFGTNAEYVYRLRRALCDLNITDPYIDALAAELTKASADG